ncbi:hypothetical protein [Brachybacterium sp. UNK5269]|uniref:hypothetical protein n=1 Tax=Brachybacterium sp. UNK5269 TaxID=3408576 RepID=UPI003BAEFE98
MNDTANTTNTARIGNLRLSLQWAWLGPVAGIACMIALVIMGLVTHTPGMTIMAASLAAVLASIWVSVNASLRRKIVQAEQA